MGTVSDNLSNISNRFYTRTSETDFNNMTRSGYFFGKFIKNTPDGTTDSNWIVEVQAFDNSTGWTFQRATRSSDKAIFTRIQDNGSWSNWEILARKSDLDPLFTPRGTLTTSADNAGIGCWRVNSVNPVNGITDGILLCFAAFDNLKVYLQFLYESDNTRGKMFMRVCWYGAWRDWVSATVS